MIADSNVQQSSNSTISVYEGSILYYKTRWVALVSRNRFSQQQNAKQCQHPTLREVCIPPGSKFRNAKRALQRIFEFSVRRALQDNQ